MAKKPSMNTRFRYTVSFESDLRPVQTVRGEFFRVDAESACKSAVHFAFSRAPRGSYRSWVVCVEALGLERTSGVETRTTAGEDAPGSTNAEVSSPLPRGQLGLDVSRRTSRG
jgi:hypothetical protein